MADLSASTVENIKKTAIPEVALAKEFVVPAYGGLSLLNVPGSLARWLGAPPLPHPAIDMPDLDGMADGVDQILMVLVDALGFDQFQSWMNDSAPQFQPLAKRGLLFPLTSVVPSTTSAALTTLWTGRSPIEHGVLGYELFLREYGLVANMITHNPISIVNGGGLLYQAGMDPTQFLPVPTLGEHLGQAGIESHGFLHTSIAHSGLSRMHYEGVHRHTFSGLADLWISVRQLLQSPSSGKRIVWVYYGGIDHHAHRYGPSSEQARLDFSLLAQSLQAGLLDKLGRQDMPKTLFLMLSDHGQIESTPNPLYDLNLHSDFTRRLVLPPTGESRLAYLHPRPGQAEAIDEYIHRTWPNQFSSFHSSYLAEKGLFGSGKPHPAAVSRLGDRTLISRGQAYLWWPAKENHMRGRHGGLSEAEMLVPFLAALI
jgi:arylsulfatase A-like enzyme